MPLRTIAPSTVVPESPCSTSSLTSARLHELDRPGLLSPVPLDYYASSSPNGSPPSQLNAALDSGRDPAHVRVAFLAGIAADVGLSAKRRTLPEVSVPVLGDGGETSTRPADIPRLQGGSIKASIVSAGGARNRTRPLLTAKGPFADPNRCCPIGSGVKAPDSLQR